MQKQLWVLLLIWMANCSYYSCINAAFTSICKSQLYGCTDNSECSYQLNENTHHVFLNEDSTVFPPVYFSNPLAVTLYNCLQTACSLPALDSNYPNTLPRDACIMEVYDICRGNIQDVFQNWGQTDSVSLCYQKYCK